MASAAPPFVSLINPADPRFMSPGDMPGKIGAFCIGTGQPAPANPGAVVRCVLESLALFYRHTLLQLESLVGRKIQRLHVVGGGSRNRLLNQFIANALGIPIFAGPAEASAIGNVMVQALALGRLPSLAAARAVVRQSSAMETFAPEAAAPWQAACARMEALVRAVSI
jgi:rhamnulokinase